MYEGKFVFTQLMEHLSWKTFKQCVERHQGDYKVHSFFCSQQYRCMTIAQLTGRESLRDIEICLRAHAPKLYHLGLPAGVSRNTLANANQVRSWKIYADFAQQLIQQAHLLYSKDDFKLQLDETVYALDSSTIDLCLSLFPWADFRTTKAGVKLHTLLNLQGNIPSFIDVTNAKMHDVKILDKLNLLPGAFYIMDRAYLDFERLYTMHKLGSFFVIRAKSNTQFKRVYSDPKNRKTGVIFDQIIALTGTKTSRHYPEHLRAVKYVDPDNGKRFVFLTNNRKFSALMIADLYRSRWYVELFFKWIKQHLRIKSFYGISENAVKTQIWIAVSVYVLIAILKKRLHLEASLYTIMQILSVTLFEKVQLTQLFAESLYRPHILDYPKQLTLFD